MFNFLIFIFMYKHFIQKRAYRFRRFCRAKYAAFRSVHLEVCIGHVASYIAEKQLVKSKITSTLACFVALTCAPLALFADDETDGFDIQNLSEVSVVAVKQQVAGEALHVVSTITAQQLQSFPQPLSTNSLIICPASTSAHAEPMGRRPTSRCAAAHSTKC